MNDTTARDLYDLYIYEGEPVDSKFDEELLEEATQLFQNELNLESFSDFIYQAEIDASW